MFIEIRHLRTLQALHNTGNLVQAAETLHLTQSALSHQIRNIEKHFEVDLLNRQSRPLKLTYAGKQLLQLAEDILPKVQRAETNINNLKEGKSGRLNIAIECHSCFEWLMPTMNNYRKTWPDVDMDITLAMQYEPLTALLSGDVDIAITSDLKFIDQVHYYPLFEYQMMLLTSDQNPICKQPYIKPADLANQTVVTYPVSPLRLDLFTRFLTPSGIQPQKIRQTELTQMMMQLVASKKGVCALPSWAINNQEDQLKQTQLGKDGLWCTLYLGVLKDQKNTPYIIDFAKQAQKTCIEILPNIRKT
jgi:LysR family transcriptional regulator for metE and metH